MHANQQVFSPDNRNFQQPMKTQLINNGNGISQQAQQEPIYIQQHIQSGQIPVQQYAQNYSQSQQIVYDQNQQMPQQKQQYARIQPIQTVDQRVLFLQQENDRLFQLTHQSTSNIEKKEYRIKELEQNIRELNTYIQRFENERQLEFQEKGMIKNELDKCKQMLIQQDKEFKVTRESFQTEYNRINELFLTKNSDLIELQRKINEADYQVGQLRIYEQRSKDYEQKLLLLTTEIENQNESLRNRITDYNDLKLKYDKVQAENYVHSQNLQRNGIQNQNYLQNEINSLQSQLASVSNEADQLRSRIQKLLTTNLELEQQRDKQNIIQKENENRISLLTKEVDRLQQLNILNVSGKSTDAEQRIKLLQKEVERLNNQGSIKNDEIDKLKRQLFQQLAKYYNRQNEQQFETKTNILLPPKDENLKKSIQQNSNNNQEKRVSIQPPSLTRVSSIQQQSPAKQRLSISSKNWKM